MIDHYTATDGSGWLIYRHRAEWIWQHEDYDGAPDAHDDRRGFEAPTREAAIAAVEEFVQGEAR